VPAPSDLIIVDDCSTYESFEIALQQQSFYPSTIVFRNEKNMGVSFSRNLGVANAKEEIVLFFDDDDRSLSHRASVHLENILLGADISYVSSTKSYPNGYGVENISEDFLGTLDPAHFAKYQLLGGKSLFAAPASCMAIRKSVFLIAGGFDVTLRRLEDIEFSIRLSTLNSIFSFSSIDCVTRFDRGGPASQFEGMAQRLILDKYKELLTDQDYREALFKIEIRDMYFNRRFIHLIIRLISELLIHPKRFHYLILGAKRMKHDWSKK
jgi:glycosyltransferase involved in cell wall biosynthesis